MADSLATNTTKPSLHQALKSKIGGARSEIPFPPPCHFSKSQGIIFGVLEWGALYVFLLWRPRLWGIKSQGLFERWVWFFTCWLSLNLLESLIKIEGKNDGSRGTWGFLCEELLQATQKARRRIWELAKRKTDENKKKEKQPREKQRSSRLQRDAVYRH